MKRKPNPKDRPERRRALAEINLIGQKGAGQKGGSQKSSRGGCAQMFSIFSVLAVGVVWLAVSTAH